MHLTPDLLSSAYDFLRHTKPFDGWNLPEPEDVDFRILKGKSRYGDCSEKNGRFCIRLSEPLHQRYSGVLATMGHEICHLHLDRVECKTRWRTLRTDNMTHGPTFRALAKQVLQHHLDFDPVTF